MTTSREIKKALTKAFKGVKFSVTTSDVLCETITIRWVGLPCINEVKEIANQWNTLKDHSDIMTDYFHYTGTDIKYERELSEDEIEMLKEAIPKQYPTVINGRSLEWCEYNIFSWVTNGEFDWRNNFGYRELSANKAIDNYLKTGSIEVSEEIKVKERITLTQLGYTWEYMLPQLNNNNKEATPTSQPFNVVEFPQKTEQTPQEIAEWAKEEYKKATGDEKTVYYQMYLDAMDKMQKLKETPQEINRKKLTKDQQIALVFDSYPELTDNQAAPIRSILDHNSGIYCPASHLTCDVLEGWKGKSSPINPKPKIVIVPPQSEAYKIIDGTAQLTPVDPEIRIYESQPLNREFLTVKTDHQDDLKTRYKQWVMAMVEQDKSEKIISFEDWKAIADFILV